MAWIDTKKRLPTGEPGQKLVPVLFVVSEAGWRDCVCAGRYSVGIKHWAWKSLQGVPFKTSEISHWQPMPAPPKRRIAKLHAAGRGN